MNTPTSPTGWVTGTVVRLVRDRGFFFVRDDGGHEYFVHRLGCEDTTLLDSLAVSDAVTFKVIPTSKGPRGVNLRRRQTQEGADGQR